MSDDFFTYKGWYNRCNRNNLPPSDFVIVLLYLSELDVIDRCYNNLPKDEQAIDNLVNRHYEMDFWKV